MVGQLAPQTANVLLVVLLLYCGPSPPLSKLSFVSSCRTQLIADSVPETVWYLAT